MRFTEYVCWLLAAALGFLMLWKTFVASASTPDFVVMTEPQMATLAVPSSDWMMLPFVMIAFIWIAFYLHQKTHP